MAGIPAVAMYAFLDVLINRGTHDSLHSLMDIVVNGSLGAATRRNARYVFTLAKKNRLRTVYAAGHYANHAAVLAAPAAANAARPLRPVEFERICHCIKCFHFLVRNGIISAEGYTHAAISYLVHASTINDGRGDVVLYIIRRRTESPMTPVRGRVAHITGPTHAIFGLVANYEAAARFYISRVQAYHLGPPVINVANYNGYMSAQSMAQMASCIDPTTADILLSWQINLGNGFSRTHGSMYHIVISSRNPHRYGMLRWLQRNHMIPQHSWNYSGPTSTRPAGGPLWLWSPLGVAMYFGDTKAVHVLGSMPGISFNQVEGIPAAKGAPIGGTGPTIGVAAARALTWNSLDAFKIWLSRTAPLLEAANQTDRILDVLRSVLETCSAKRVAISAERLPANTLIGVHRRSKARRRQMVLDVALAFVYTIQETAFHSATVQPDGTLKIVKMFETPWYHDWKATIRRENRVPATRFCRDVGALMSALHRGGQRNHRSERNFMDIATRRSGRR